jgi:dTDP-4-dehydrorhamnose 3,5-epimerase
VIFLSTTLPGAFVIEPERRLDERGYFARTWCRREFESAGLHADFVQSSISKSLKKRTLRGMHWQASPHEEVKLVRCTRGAIWDAIIDLRSASPTYMKHFAVELTAESGWALYIPVGLAHGFVTLDDESEVLYQMSNYYEPAAARGVRWNDPAFSVTWPVVDPILHPRDAAYRDFVPELTPLPY